jgi:hypothetical protein
MFGRNLVYVTQACRTQNFYRIAERYRLHNKAAKCFFADFSKDPMRRDAFMPEGVVPKPKPIKEGVLGPPEYVYLIPDTSSDNLEATKAKP